MKRFIFAVSVTVFAITSAIAMPNANAQAANAPQQIQDEQLQACNGNKSRDTNQDGQSRGNSRA